MQERLLQYIWKFQYYHYSDLATSQGEALQVIFPGHAHGNQGPDFFNAKLVIGGTTWAGNVEVHIRSSDWNLHRHTGDDHYANVILHVVWEHDLPDDALPFPTLELQSRVSNNMLERYNTLMRENRFIPCETQLHRIGHIHLLAAMDKMVAEKLEHKARDIRDILQRNIWHWDELLWWMIARNFGMPLNGELFEAVAQSIPIQVLIKNATALDMLEAMLFGQAGLLKPNMNDPYAARLKKEYTYLAKKYNFKKVHFSPVYLRMRPANFPTVRMAQLAAFAEKSPDLFSVIKEAVNSGEIEDMLQVTASTYWDDHYSFDQPSPSKPKRIGQERAHNIMINTIVPVLYAYGLLSGDAAIKQKSLKWLQLMKAEKNQTTKAFEALGFIHKHAFDSQALLYMKKEYCDKRNCLRCSIGHAILKKDHTDPGSETRPFSVSQS